VAEISKLSVEKVLEKLRRDDAESKETLREKKADALNEKLEELRRQRLRLDRRLPKLD
jgi:hypothetical protein